MFCPFKDFLGFSVQKGVLTHGHMKDSDLICRHSYKSKRFNVF